MFECFHCCTRSVIYDSDFDFSDFGYEGGGIIDIQQEDEDASKKG